MQLFISYAHTDERHRKKLGNHLAQLRREGLLDDWHDGKIVAGYEWDAQIKQFLNSADVILLLVSDDFLASDYCYDVEMNRAMERHKEGTARVIPVIVRACDWHDAPFGKLRALPRDGRPIVRTGDRDRVWTEVAKEIRAIVRELPSRKATVPEEVHSNGTGKPAVAVATITETREVELILDRPFDSYSAREKERLLRAIGGLLSVVDVKVTKNRKASVSLTLKLTPAQAERLYRAAQRGELIEFDVREAILHGDESPVSSDARQSGKTEKQIGKVTRFTRPTPQGPVSFSNSIGMPFALVPAGQFMMGSADADKEAFENERSQHTVSFTKPLLLGIYPVTQYEYEQVTRRNPSHFRHDAACPVSDVTWRDAVKFCIQLSERESLLPHYAIDKGKITVVSGTGYRLPTEAEWEYACRAGSRTAYCFGNDPSQLADYAWFEANSGGTTQPVGGKKPNAWGFHDMHGNVWEWCQDAWVENHSRDEVTDPVATPDKLGKNSDRVVRGGSWGLRAGYCRSAIRARLRADGRFWDQGFRVCLVSGPVAVPNRIKQQSARGGVSEGRKAEAAHAQSAAGRVRSGAFGRSERSRPARAKAGSG